MVKELEDIAPPENEGSHDILYSEVQAAISSLKRNKSPGSDGITAEMLQAGGEPLSREIHKLCNKAWHEGTIPEEWGKSILVPIPKKGDLNFQKAFDTIKHKIIWAMLRSYGVDVKMITLLQNIYEKSQSAVRIGTDYGEWFRTDVGTRQGDPLSPLLFIAYLERVMDQVRQSTCGINISGTVINNLRFADDIDLIDEDNSSLQRQVELTKTAAEQAGLILNINKTKTMVFGDRNIDNSMQVVPEQLNSPLHSSTATGAISPLSQSSTATIAPLPTPSPRTMVPEAGFREINGIPRNRPFPCRI
ncbi:unnamed protein product, partial [Adineta ricciae]